MLYYTYIFVLFAHFNFDFLSPCKFSKVVSYDYMTTMYLKTQL